MRCTEQRPRLTLAAGDAKDLRRELAADVRAGLTASPKRLSCRFFYDDAGSRLFEEICALPEYYLTRAEREILEARAGAIAASAAAAGADTLVELGSGSSVKTRLLIDAILELRPRLLYAPIDISAGMLEESAAALLETFDRLEIHAVAAEYRDGLAHVAGRLAAPRLFLWLGSNIGNLDHAAAAAFLRDLAAMMEPRDRFLLGVDLRKDRRALERAYDDAQGVTARFDLNILERINRELGGRFDTSLFAHEAVWDEAAGRVDMFLRSTAAQRVAIDGLDLEVSFGRGERIHTESSYKWSPPELEDLAAATGFAVESAWLDSERRFTVLLLRPS